MQRWPPGVKGARVRSQMMLRSARPPMLRPAGKRAPEDEGVKGKVRGSSRTSRSAEAERPAQTLPGPVQAPFQARLGHDFGSIPVQHSPGARGAPAPTAAPAGPGKVAK